MVELTIGSRFRLKGKLCEVVEDKNGVECGRCVFDEYANKCIKAKCCSDERHDRKSVYFKEVKE